MAQTIFITGASSGIGPSSAKLFFDKGWNVVATMRSPSKDTVLITLDPARMLIHPLDLQDPSSIQPAMNAAITKFQKIDLLLNNAGYGGSGVFEAVPREVIQAQFDVNLFGLMDVTRALLPHLRETNSGGIINVSSGLGFYAFPMISIYTATKFALEGYTVSSSPRRTIFVEQTSHSGVRFPRPGHTSHLWRRRKRRLRRRSRG